MVNATFVDVEGFQIDGTAEEILFIQGPDLPTSSSTVAAEASSNNVDQCGENSDFHRIVISDEIDVEQGETQEIVVSGATSSVSKKVKKSPTKIKVEKKSNAVTAIKGTYELEKALLAATSIPAKIDLLQILTVKQASKLLQGAMEPDVLYLLLKTVFDVYHMKYLTIDDLLKWLECCSTVSNFSLLFSLLPEKQKAELQNHVSNVSVEQSESDLRFIQRLSGLKRVYN